MCKRIEEEVEPQSGSQRHRHFVGFFNVPVHAPTRATLSYGYSEPKLPHLVPCYDTLGIRRTYYRKPPGSPRVQPYTKKRIRNGLYAFHIEMGDRVIGLILGPNFYF